MLIVLKCEKCNKQIKRIVSNQEAALDLFCKVCQTKLVRESQGVTYTMKEVLDNGLQTKAIERYVDAEIVYNEHSKVEK